MCRSGRFCVGDDLTTDVASARYSLKSMRMQAWIKPQGADLMHTADSRPAAA